MAFFLLSDLCEKILFRKNIICNLFLTFAAWISFESYLSFLRIADALGFRLLLDRGMNDVKQGL